MSTAANVTDATFNSDVLKSEIPVMIDFWAVWCNPCKMIAPVIDKMAAAYEGKLKVVKMDVDSNSNTPSELGIRSIPTLMFFKNGEMVNQIVGVVSEAQLKKVIDTVLG
ncbi:MAG: Thioredoxin [Candidatus Aerophobetes bacterium ADurb.Bin490]|nr:MAG: Thioredoxin [Candidatus Aerophobetes bacterium ADurb.Bin490]HNZ28704.1 thioredoxin [Candidatus Goldiibacteriota bacterium]HPI03200.1 thioredoxin [Candidatus Goldiibacteriota bacterium]HRQ44921.1 thioredoxin [Candidatus Goldiibacteriota bacterium]